MVDMISTDSLGIAAPFLCHIIDMAALPSQQTTRRLSQQLLSKCDPGGLARLRSKKKNKPAAALIWSVLANRLAGEMSSTLFSEAVCECLLNNIEHDPDMSCKVFSIIALEKFSLTGPCKARIMQTPIRRLLRDVANMSTNGLTDQNEISGVLQAKFCAEWSLRNIFRDMTEDTKGIAGMDQRGDLSPTISQAVDDLAARISRPPTPKDSVIKAGSSTPTINVMLNTLDATMHWKISGDGLSIRNDGSTFESIRATKSISQGKWFYEVTLVTAGIMQLGWATVHCQFSPEDGTGVGDDIFGFAYDGCRNLIWSDGESESYGGSEAWRPGDVVGFYLDIDNAIMECFLNGRSLGKVTPFEMDHFGAQAVSGYYPALSFTSFQQATVNFGATPFRYPPALPWRNLNDHGAITPEMRAAIVRPKNDSVYGRIHVDPVTGIRLPSMPEGDTEIDYSLLCTICCDHTATVTLQPCGHDGLCVECAYSLDMCPLCRSRIFQRQMFPSSESKDAGSSVINCIDGLGISGLGSSDESSVNTSALGLSASSTLTSTWSAEYCGPAPPVVNLGRASMPSSSNTTTTTTTTEDVTTGDSNAHSDTEAAASVAAVVMAATAAPNSDPLLPQRQSQHQQHQQHQPRQSAPFPYTRSPSTESLSSRRRYTLAGSLPSPSPGLAANRVALEDECLQDPFSPPSTAYFAFLNRPPRMQRSQLHPMDLDGDVDPLEGPVRQLHSRHPLSSSEGNDQANLRFRATSGLLTGNNRSAPSVPSVGLGLELNPSGPVTDDPIFASAAMRQEDSLESESESEEDVVLVEEGREASDSEVMEQSALDFQDGHSIHSRRNSVQITAGASLAPAPLFPPAIPSSLTGTHTGVGGAMMLPPGLMMSSAMAGGGSGSGTTMRFGGRRASMPSNRLEM
ncbi:hypothetical protein BC939DRAFT_462388 [Gamsiella multidivaricata]|uniref:uncharacterized protein n=1 Tax=Gamsiella multidivaricata TaxID=101098 RepID=UPI00221E3FDE|nr:uncharacterized protein BC939DRAFT_462388 [Gamsiella multidivaricata]KAI7818651.1 hypothetical protein BC939DRAFT_462388 [Gamsiella multidivaricata]